MRARRLLVAASLVVPVGCGSTAPASLEQASDCLKQHDFRITGPLERSPGDTDAPDRTIYVASRNPAVSAALGYYDDAARAERSAAEQIEHSRDYGGRVDRYGKLTIIWIVGKDSGGRDQIENCALNR